MMINSTPINSTSPDFSPPTSPEAPRPKEKIILKDSARRDFENTIISPIKREQLRKAEKAERKRKMREDLPVYTMKEIRRYRMPLHEAVKIELEEQNLLSSATFLKQLIDYQEWMRESNGPESKVWAKPRIIDRTDVLLNLSQGFKRAEIAHHNNDFANELDEFLHLSVKYAFEGDDWWWLGEQLLLQCNELAKNYEGDGFRRYAIAEYIFGKFLYENLLDREQATARLRHARVLSLGHSWTAAKYLQYAQKTVFVECCILLYKVLLDDAKEMMKYDAKGAISLCVKAKRRAYDACIHEGEAQSLLLQGHCHMLINEVNEAAQCFYKVLLMQTKAKNHLECCEARIWLIRAYLKLGHWEESYGHLQKLLEFALENNLPYYVGQAYRYMGEYYLNHGNPNLATPLLLKAIEAFHEIGDVDNREQVKNFAAVSAGQELMPKYIRYIVKCGGKGSNAWKYLQKLLAWKDLRRSMWYESEITLSMRSSCMESGLELRSLDFGEEEEYYEGSSESVQSLSKCDITLSTISSMFKQAASTTDTIATSSTAVRSKKSVTIKLDTDEDNKD